MPANERQINVRLNEIPTQGMTEFLALARAGKVPIEIELKNDPFEKLKVQKIPVKLDADFSSIEQGIANIQSKLDNMVSNIRTKLDALNSNAFKGLLDQFGTPLTQANEGINRFGKGLSESATQALRLNTEARQLRRALGPELSPETISRFTSAGGRQEVATRAQQLSVNTGEAIKLTQAQQKSDAAIEKQIRKVEAQFAKPSAAEFISTIFGGGEGRQAARAIRASQVALNNPGLPGLESRLLSGKPSSFFQPGNLKDTGTLAQIGFASVFGGLPGALVSTAAAVTPFGKEGALFASTLQQGAGALLEPILTAFHERQKDFEAAGEAFSRSLLGIGSVLQATTTVLDASGNALGSRNIGGQVRFQEKQAEQIQLAARSRLLPLGISGATESTFVQGITSALAQRGISATSEQTAVIAERLGGVIRATRPQLLENPSLLNRDLQDVLSGLPQAQRTVLGSVLRGSLPKLGSAKSGEDVVSALDKVAPYAESVQNSQNIGAVLDRLSGQKELLNTIGGNAFFEQLKPGVQSFTETLKGDDVKKAVEAIGAAMGSLAKTSLQFEASLVKLGAGFTNVVAPLGRLLSGLEPVAPALIGLALATTGLRTAADQAKLHVAEQGAVGAFAQSTSTLESQAAITNAAALFGGAGGGGGAGLLTKQLSLKGLGSKLLSPVGGGLIGKLLPPVLLAGLGVDIASQTLDSLDESAASREENANAPIQDAIDKLQTSRSKASAGTQITALLNASGVGDTIQKSGAERRTTGGGQLSALNLAESQFGGTKEFAKTAPEFYAAKITALQTDFEERTKAFNGVEGDIFKQEVFRKSVVGEQVKAAEKEVEALKAREEKRQGALKGGKSVGEELADVNKEIARVSAQRRAAIQFGRSAREVGQINASEIGNEALGLGGVTKSKAAEINNQRQAEVVEATAKLKELESRRTALTAEQKTGNNNELNANAQVLIEAQRKIVDLKNQELESAQKEASLFENLANNSKGAFQFSTQGGAQRGLSEQQGLIGNALKSAQTATTTVREQLALIGSQKELLQKDLSTRKDKGVIGKDQRELANLDALEKSKQLQLKSAQFDEERVRQKQNELSLSQKENNLGAQGVEERLQGVDKGTFAGQQLASQLEAQRAAISLNAKSQQIGENESQLGALRSAGKGGSFEALSIQDSIEKLKAGYGSDFVAFNNAQRGATNAGFAGREGSDQLQKALVDSAYAVQEEVAKRREATDALNLSKLALGEFDKSLQAARADKENSLVGLAAKIRGEGGSINGGIDTSPEALKQSQLAADVARFNKEANNAGTLAYAAGGKSQNIVAPNSPFEQSQEAERHRLEDAVLRNSEAFEKLNPTMDEFNLQIERTVTTLQAQLGPAEPAFKGTPGFGIPTPGEISAEAKNGGYEAIGAISKFGEEGSSDIVDALNEAINGIAPAFGAVMKNVVQKVELTPSSTQGVGQAVSDNFRV